MSPMPPPWPTPPRSALTAGAGRRMAAVLPVLLLLWAAVAWALA